MRKTVRSPRFGSDFLERKLSPSGGLIMPPAEVQSVSTSTDEVPTQPPTIPYPPIYGGPPLYPPLVPGGPLGPD